MVEIAICLAIIGIALVAIIGVLPIGINVQRDNREETLIDQDATVFLENIRNGARGLDDLTNYVYAISNSWTLYPLGGGPPVSGNNGYTYTNAFAYFTSVPAMALTNGANIIGLLTTPEYTGSSGAPLSSLANGGYSNYVVAYVRSLSGLAVEKPPQDNAIMVGDSFSYKMICQNVPVAVYTPSLWKAQRYFAGAYVSYLLNGQMTFWRATANVSPGDLGPTRSSLWVQDAYPTQLAANLRELRLTFLWPLLPNGTPGNGRQTFRTTVAGQIIYTNIDSSIDIKNASYFFQPQFFTNAP
jgi:type II secretory pathway pseudopilin PulG